MYEHWPVLQRNADQWMPSSHQFASYYNITFKLKTFPRYILEIDWIKVVLSDSKTPKLKLG